MILMRLWILTGLMLFGLTPAHSIDTQYLQGMNNPDYFKVSSSELERSFHIYTRLPQGYESGGSELYPTVYLLDGGHTFPMLSAFYQYLVFGEELPKAIIVGISYGNDDWKQGNFRSTDYTVPAESAPHYGGAANFSRFLEEVLIPYVESRYKSDRSKRILFGQSLGGQFVLFTAQEKPNLFYGYVASNPALHRNLEYFIQPIEKTALPKPRLYVSSGSNDVPRFRDPALAWMDYWNDVKDRPWKLRMETLAGESHFSAAPQAFRKGVSWILSGTNSE